MSTESEVIKARYSRVEKEADAFGRVIGVRRLKPSEQSRIIGLLPDLQGNEEVTAPDGTKFQVPSRLPLLMASAVCMIDDAHIPFSKTRGELDAIFDRLDEEGIRAATTAMGRLMAELPDGDPKELAKNS